MEEAGDWHAGRRAREKGIKREGCTSPAPHLTAFFCWLILVTLAVLGEEGAGRGERT
jgi:hypothetical protein